MRGIRCDTPESGVSRRAGGERPQRGRAWSWVLLALGWLALVSLAWAAPAATLDVSSLRGRTAEPLTVPFELTPADASLRTADPMTPPPSQARWTPQRDGLRSLGFVPAGMWVRARLRNPGDAGLEVWLLVADGYLDKVDCFVDVSQAGGAPAQQLVRTGDARPFHVRPLEIGRAHV